MAFVSGRLEIFTGIRRKFGALRQGQVDGINAILDATAAWPRAAAAYALATSWHETGRTMQPVRERGSGDGADADPWDDYLERYDTGAAARALGNTPAADGDGVLYAGRGYVQLTGRSNYEKMGARLGLPLLQSPDLALRPDVAADILAFGMVEGTFTGRKLSEFITPAKTDFINARRVINGLDRARPIAAYAERFLEALCGTP